MEQVTKNFNKATASAANTAKGMSRVSGVMGTIGSVANMAAIGGIFAMMASFLEGLKGAGEPRMVAGKLDMSNAGQKGMRYNPMNLFQKGLQGWRMTGGVIRGLFGDEEYKKQIWKDVYSYNRKKACSLI